MAGVACNQGEHKVVRAAHHVAFAYFRPFCHLVFKCGEDGVVLTVEADQSQKLHFKSKQFSVDVGVVAMNEACFFKGADPSEARWCRDSGPFGKFYVGNPSIVLQITENPHVDGVEFNFLHRHIL